MSRLLCDIAREIRADWKNVSPYAQYYLDAMWSMGSIKENYYVDSGESIVAYFLGNAASWKGEVARRVKLELKGMLK